MFRASGQNMACIISISLFCLHNGQAALYCASPPHMWQGVPHSRRFLHNRPDPMPGLYHYGKHCLNICRHPYLLLSSRAAIQMTALAAAFPTSFKILNPVCMIKSSLFLHAVTLPFGIHNALVNLLQKNNISTLRFCLRICTLRGDIKKDRHF